MPCETEGYQFAWFQEHPRGQFAFQSVWDVAKAFLDNHDVSTELFCTVGERRWEKGDSDFFTHGRLLVRWPAVSAQVWPGAYKEPRLKRPPNLSSLFKRDGPPKSKKPKGPSVQDVHPGALPAPKGKAKAKPKAAPGLHDAGAAGLFHLVDEEDVPSDSDSDDGQAKPPREPDVAPPLPAPPEAPDAPAPAEPAPAPKRVVYSRGGGDYKSISILGGEIHWSTNLKQINAHCGNPDHVVGAAKCKMDRRLLLASGARRRPLGLVMAWLGQCGCDAKDDHHRLKTRLWGTT